VTRAQPSSRAGRVRLDPSSLNRRVADRRGIGFGWLQNAWLLHGHARLKILTRIL
jgi:hypothetical protein